MATKVVKIGGVKVEHIVAAVLLAILFKVAIDEGAAIAEHGLDNWRRDRLGW